MSGDAFHYWQYFYFIVIDPNNVTFVDFEPYTIGMRYNFTFKVFASGEHRLSWDNSGDGARYIELVYDVESESPLPSLPPTPKIVPDTGVFLPTSLVYATAIAFVALLVIIVVLLIRRKK